MPYIGESVFALNNFVIYLVDNKDIFATFAIIFSKCKIDMKKEIEFKKENSYRFIYDEEPTDDQLHQIMKEVGIDVRKRAEIANKKFEDELQQLCLLKGKQQL